MTITFNNPSSGSGYLRASDHNGHLILITIVHKIEDQYSTMAGKNITTAVVDFVDLDGDQHLREQLVISNIGIVNRLRQGATYVLGRIGTVPSKMGGQPAFVLNNADTTLGSTDLAQAQAWVDKQAAGKFQAPAAAPAPAAAAPAVQPTIVADTGALAGFSPEQLAALQNLIK